MVDPTADERPPACRRSRIVLLMMVCLAMVAASSCSSCGWRSSRAARNVIQVRWPPTAPAGRTQELLDVVRVEAPEPLLPESHVAPGVRVRESVVHGLRYFEVILGEADFDDSLPMVVLLHGRGDRPRIPGGPFSGVPIPMRLVMPRGPLRVGAGYAWVQRSVTQGEYDLLAAALQERTHHLAITIETLCNMLPTMGRPVVAGFSQGAMLAFSLALQRPDIVGRAFPLAGWIPPGLLPASPVAPEQRVPIRSLHGTQDPVIPIGPTREVVAALRALEWEVELLEFEGVGHEISPAMNATFEAWLEESLRDLAPALTGLGLGQEGPEAEPYEPFEALDEETIQAIEALEGIDSDDEGGETMGEPAPASDPMLEAQPGLTIRRDRDY